MTSAAWPLKTMDELCEITSSKRIFAADYVSEGVPFYRGREITERYKGNLDVSTELFIREEKFREIESKFGAPRQGDLLLTSVGTLGSVYLVKSGDRFYFKDGNITWFRNFRGIKSHFLYYWLGSPQGKAELQKCTIGSSQSAYTIVLLKSMTLKAPPLDVQQRIAEILSTYDDLIDVNQRRIAILEQIARRLFDEWFVRFRYPGHEAVPLVETELGVVPEGWQPRTLSWWAEEVRDTISPQQIDPMFPYVGLEHLPRRSTTLLDVGRARDVASSKLKFEAGDVLFGRIRPYFHKVALMPFAGVCSTDAICIRPTNPKFTALILGLLSSDTFVAHAVATSNGTKMPRADWKVLKKYALPKPPEHILAAFERVAAPMAQSAANLAAQNTRLRTARDMLLPRLISGEIDVSVAAATYAKAAE